ncbi:uncharacterized protein LOC131669236 isoform X2 [Phymastichus coffea]|uniref:uncharacterized protein LOC131669236 isoform X2 n=1 Tax=Phymastichus coffea TaxID=108790 RepID=UPI00273B7165|nr:uncharacterized protein LOC131669236 isoform X2 [Phymastichus coffea]
MFNRINRDLVPIKAHYFLFYAGTSPLMQFLPTVAKQLGFSGKEVGFIYTILPISGLIAKPLFGSFADKFRLHKGIFIAFQVILAIAFLTINFIPEEEPSASSRLTCRGDTFLRICSKDELPKEPIYLQDIVSCQLVCSVTPNDTISICNSWHIDDVCVSNKDKMEYEQQMQNLKLINFKISFNMSYDDQLEATKCLYMKVQSATFASGNISKTWCAMSPFDVPCRIRCPKVPYLDSLIKNISQTDPQKPSSWNFQWFLWACIISWIGMAVVVSIGDAICINLLGDSKNHDYGKQKMWGSVGVGIFGIGIGYLIDLFSKGQEIKDYSSAFYIMLIIMAFDVAVSSMLKKPMDGTNEPSVFWELWSIFKEGRVLVFAWWCVGAGMCTGVVWNFLFWYTEDISTGKEWLKTLQGLLTGVQCFFGEMPFNFISGNILRKIGHINVMSLVLLIYSIRFMAYSIFANVWVFLVLELLHGPSFGLCWPTMVSYGDKVSPSGTKATIQGLVGAIFEGIGVSAGSLLCGYLMDKYKGIITFRVFSVGALIWLSSFWILQLLLRKTKAYPLQQGHTHLASYALDDDAIIMTMSQEMQTY